MTGPQNLLAPKLGIKDWQCNIVEELLDMREMGLEANLDIFFLL